MAVLTPYSSVFMQRLCSLRVCKTSAASTVAGWGEVMILSFCLLQLVESPTLPDPNNLFKWHVKLRGFDDSCPGVRADH